MKIFLLFIIFLLLLGCSSIDDFKVGGTYLIQKNGAYDSDVIYEITCTRKTDFCCIF